MKSQRVNADYESVLFHGKPSSVINQAIEFFLFFLSDAPLNSSKKYDPAYLEYVHSLTGRRPVIVSQADYENWWGPLTNPELERWWNSKATSRLLNPDSFMLASENDLLKLQLDQRYLLKDPFGMSGQRMQLYRSDEANKLKWPLLAEPFFDRVHDFSHYVFPDGKVIAYENLVDGRFQYKGTVFTRLDNAVVENLSFYSELSAAHWKKFASELTHIQAFYAQEQNLTGYSIDSFTYRQQEQLHIRALSEVNYRRTMGRCAYELGIRHSEGEWFGFFLLKRGNQPLWKMPELSKLVMVLSPGDSRFEILTLAASDAATAKEKISEVNALLANAQTAIEF